MLQRACYILVGFFLIPAFRIYDVIKAFSFTNLSMHSVDFKTKNVLL